MADRLISIDTTKTPGQQLPSAVVDEINELIPDSVPTTWDTIEQKPKVIASGVDAAAARLTIAAEDANAKGKPDGYAPLGAFGLVPEDFLPPPHTISVREARFGLKPGDVDNTDAIKAAIKAAQDAADDTGSRRVSIVYCPRRKYRIRNIDVPTCVKLEGDDATLVAVAGTTGHLVTLKPGFYGGLHRMRIVAANQDDLLGGVHVETDRRSASMSECVVEGFRGRAVLWEGGNPIIYRNLLSGLLGVQDHLTTFTGALELRGQANDAMCADNEVNGSRWHYNPDWSRPPTAERNMYVCAIATIDVGLGMFRNNIAELGETGWYLKNHIQIHMSGNRAEFCWGHGYIFEHGSGRVEGNLAMENSKVESGKYDGFHWGAGDLADNASDHQTIANASRSNMGVYGDFKQHRWGYFDNSFNPNYGNVYANNRSYGDVGMYSGSVNKPDYYGGGPQYSFPNAHSAAYLSGATPSVAGKTLFRTNGATTITDFTGAVNGQWWRVIGNGQVAVEHGTNIQMCSGATTVIPNGVWYEFTKHDGKIYQVDMSASTLANKIVKLGKFDVLCAPNGLAVLAFDSVTDAVSTLHMSPGAAGSPFNLRVHTTDPSGNCGLRLQPAGNGPVILYAGKTGIPMTIYATGPDPFHDLNLATNPGGKVMANNVEVATISAAQRFTMKRIDPRVNSTTTAATLTPDISASDVYSLTGLAEALTVAAPTGTPANGNRLTIRIRDNGTPQTIAWNAAWRGIGVALPTTTVAGKWLYANAIYNSIDVKWDVIDVKQQA